MLIRINCFIGGILLLSLVNLAGCHIRLGVNNEPATESAVIRIKQNDYTITGNSAAALRAQMEKNGPIYSERTWWAATHWAYDWDVDCRHTSAGVVPVDVQVSLDVRYNLPHWENQAAADAALSANWRSCFTAIRIHEDQHGLIAIRHAEILRHRLSALPPCASCQDLKAKARAIWQTLYNEVKQQQEEFDRNSQHGRLTGIRLE